MVVVPKVMKGTHHESMCSQELYALTEEETGQVVEVVKGKGLALGYVQVKLIWEDLFIERDLRHVDNDVARLFADLQLDPEHGTITTAQLIIYLDSLAVATREYLKNMPHAWSDSIWEVVGYGRKTSNTMKYLSYAYISLMQIMIGGSVVLLMLASLPRHLDRNGDLAASSIFSIFDVIIVFVFTVDLLLTTLSYPRGVREYVCGLWFWIDLCSVLPFYLTMFGVVSGSEAKGLQALKVVRMGLRLTQIMRVLKLGKRSNGMSLILASLKNTRELVLLMMVAALMTVTFCGSLLYYAEKESAEFDFTTKKWVRNVNSSLPDAGLPIFFQSIPDTFWFEWVSLTTVGYGDVYPVTPLGKAVSSITMVSSLFVIGYPTTVMMSAFIQEYSKDQTRRANEHHRDMLIASMKQSLTGSGANLPSPPSFHELRFMQGLENTSKRLELTSRRSSYLRRSSKLALADTSDVRVEVSEGDSEDYY